MLIREKKHPVRGDYKRSWMSDDYFDLVVWYERSNAIHGFQLCDDTRWLNAGAAGSNLTSDKGLSDPPRKA